MRPRDEGGTASQAEPPKRRGTRWGKVQAWWFEHPGIDADSIAVLAVLATYADAQGVCAPSQSTIARQLDRSRPWVNRVLGKLAEIGLVTKQQRRRENGGTSSCLYHLRFEQSPSSNPCPDTDTPCHQPDRTRTPPEHTRLRRGTPPAPATLPPSDWQPSQQARQRAASIAPDLDIDRHVGRFISRSIDNGYRYRPDRVEAAWLQWLEEDAGRTLKGRSPGRGHGPAPSRVTPIAQFDAWAAAAEALGNG